MPTATVEREQAPSTSQAKYPDKRKKELRDAAERVYRRYGTNLVAFRRDIQRELEKREG